MSMALWMSALGALALTSGIAVAAVELPKGDQPVGDLTRAQVEARVTQAFERMDADEDGRLTPADRQAMRARMADRMFDRLDADRDGQISRAEFDAGAARLAAAHTMRGPGRHGAMMMKRADADGDGAVTRQEMLARALARFDRADADGDGVITAAEREQARAAMRARLGS